MKNQAIYRKFTRKAEIEKSINSLLGMIEGITVDGVINEDEIHFFEQWLLDHQDVQKTHPFNELVPVVTQAASDGVISEEEKLDIQWLCERLTSTEYFNKATADMQKLHAILAGISSDGSITESELRGLSNWLQEHVDLRCCWPYDEVQSLLITVMADKKIDANEHKLLLGFFNEFVDILDNKTIVSPKVSEGESLVGLCAVCPEIDFNNSVFCITGKSHRYSRDEFESVVADLGGKISSTISQGVNYLIVGSEGNPSWSYACYGRKVERAVELRKKGFPILIVHENDFYDAVEDS